MPFTFVVSDKQASDAQLQHQDPEEPRDMFGDKKKKEKPKPARQVISTSAQKDNPTRVRCKHGFLRAVTEAYNNHHHLILRPDDVWLAITTQFSTYVNQNAEALRSKFVDFEDKKELVVVAGGTLFTAPYDQLARDMSQEIAKNIRDPSVREWVLPGFTTTTNSDLVVGSVVLMAAMQQFFTYKFALRCGLPSVTLLGEVSDWQDIERRAARLVEHDVNGQMVSWAKLLAPVLAQFTKAAQGNPDVAFWQKICHYVGGGSGPTWLSGWITVFSVFTDDGKWMGDSKTAKSWNTNEKGDWPFVDTHDLPSGCVSVPVVVDDNGKIYNTTMEAGHSALNIVEKNSLQPTLEWVLLLDGDKK